MNRNFDFAKRLCLLRTNKGVSARDMSLSLGQNPSYINKVENGKSLPSMEMFFYICDYLSVTPAEFFEEQKSYPLKVRQISEACASLTGETLEHLLAIIKTLSKSPR